MELVVEILTGRFFHVEVEDDATVGSLKKAIASKEMFQEQRLVLMLSNGRLLRDDQCALAECGVVDGSIIYLFFSYCQSLFICSILFISYFLYYRIYLSYSIHSSIE